MRTTLFAMAGIGALIALPSFAAAQDNPAPGMQPGTQPGMMEAPPPPAGAVCPPGTTPQVVEEPMAPPPPAKPRAEFSPANQSFTLGGGVADFVRDRINDHTTVGGAWDARYLLGTRSYFGFEANYMGSAAGVNGAIDNNNGHIISHQVAGSLRLSASRGRFQPFVTAGAGWEHFNLTRTGVTDTITISDTSNSFVAPFGAGFAGYFGRHGVIDARGTYNLITNKDLTTGGARPDMWGAELRLGYAF